MSDRAMIGIEIETSKLRVEPVGNVRDLFLLDSIFSGLVVMFVDQLGPSWEGGLDLNVSNSRNRRYSKHVGLIMFYDREVFAGLR